MEFNFNSVNSVDFGSILKTYKYIVCIFLHFLGQFWFHILCGRFSFLIYFYFFHVKGNRKKASKQKSAMHKKWVKVESNLKSQNYIRSKYKATPPKKFILHYIGFGGFSV